MTPEDHQRAILEAEERGRLAGYQDGLRAARKVAQDALRQAMDRHQEELGEAFDAGRERGFHQAQAGLDFMADPDPHPAD